MRKISYWSSVEEPKRPEKKFPVGLIGRNTDGIGLDADRATENGGSFGITLLEMSKEPEMGVGVDPDQYKSEFDGEGKGEEVIDEDIMDILVNLADEMDKVREHNLANFTDFLIKKFAESNEVNFTKKFNDLMIKINNSDLSDRNETIKKLTKIYSRTLVLEFMDKDDMDRARESAYKKTIHRADQYLAEE
jgi:hypothetical protein